MLILPFTSRLGFRPIPWVTIILIVLNCAVLFILQSGDQARYAEAVRSYFASSLPDIEIPAYAEYLEQQGRTEEASRVRHAAKTRLAREGLPIRMQHEGRFVELMHKHRWIKPDDPRFKQWLIDRNGFEAKLADIVSEAYAFKPDAAEVGDMFTHMFLHAGFGHLLGNMIFLFLLGVVVERLIGPYFYALSYLAGGLIAASFFALLGASTGSAIIGASGAVSALMGIYVVLFGWRKIPFFYSVGFYFDYVRAPALLLLVAFLGKELFEHFTHHDNVAYMAHFGGALAGALFGTIIGRIRDIPVDALLADMEASERDAHVRPWREEFDQAMGLVEKLKYSEAASILARLHKAYPEDIELAREWFKVTSNRPSDEGFHAAALAVLSRKPGNRMDANEIHQAFQTYLDLAQPRPRLKYGMLFGLVDTFCRYGFLQDADRILRWLKHQPGDFDRIAPLALTLARRWRLQGEEERARPLLAWVANGANPKLAKQAKTLLKCK